MRRLWNKNNKEAGLEFPSFSFFVLWLSGSLVLGVFLAVLAFYLSVDQARDLSNEFFLRISPLLEDLVHTSSKAFSIVDRKVFAVRTTIGTDRHSSDF